MARIDPPVGYSSWNVYIEEQADLSPDQSIESRRLIKRDIKLGMIAEIERQANGNELSPSYRPYNVYISPGTSSPTLGHPWLISSPILQDRLLQEDRSLLLQEDRSKIIC